MRSIDWQSPTWGEPGHNVTYAANGSWVEPAEAVES